MQQRRPVPLRFNIEPYQSYFIATVSVRAEDYVCIKAYPSQHFLASHCKDFLDYYFGLSQLPIEWQRIRSISPGDYMKAKQRLFDSILNVKRKQCQV